MTDESTASETTTTEDTATPTEADADAVVGIVSDGAHSLIVARFRTMAEAEDAYQALTEIERTTSWKIDSVLVASCDHEGKIHLGKVTEHSTKTGLKWGVVGGAVAGIIFPPSLLAGAVGAGVAGAAIGKIRNILHRGGIAKELADVMKPDTSGVIALVEDTAVVEIERALAKADEIVTKAVNEQIVAEIDREARRAEEAVINS
jgi:uncharacterized membrane protein